jgi:hypothetical protein
MEQNDEAEYVHAEEGGGKWTRIIGRPGDDLAVGPRMSNI